MIGHGGHNECSGEAAVGADLQRSAVGGLHILGGRVIACQGLELAQVDHEARSGGQTGDSNPYGFTGRGGRRVDAQSAVGKALVPCRGGGYARSDCARLLLKRRSLVQYALPRGSAHGASAIAGAATKTESKSKLASVASSFCERATITVLPPERT